MYYVYLIKCIQFPEILYVGYTTDIEQRLRVHNSGGSFHTAKYKPWELIMYVVFVEEKAAKEFEKYLKTQSGRAFTKRRFLIH
jgi:putative endonuclease